MRTLLPSPPQDGERLRYGTGDEYRKHCLRRVGRRYYFTVNDVQPEDAGVYQVRVEDVPIFSTELDAQGKELSLMDVMCNCDKSLGIFAGKLCLGGSAKLSNS